MGPLPKIKISKGRRNRRRAHHAIGTPKVVSCSQCNQKTLPHRVCPNCGSYMGRMQILDIDEETA